MAARAELDAVIRRDEVASASLATAEQRLQAFDLQFATDRD